MSRGEQGRRKCCSEPLEARRSCLHPECHGERHVDHAAGMWQTMEKARVQRPQMTPAQAADLFAFFAGAWRVDKAGDPAQGGRIYQAKHCASCHDEPFLGAPNLAAQAGTFSSFSMVSSLWQHGAGMLSRMVSKEHGVAEIHAGGNVPPDRASEQQKTVRVDLPAFVGKLFEEHDADVRGRGSGCWRTESLARCQCRAAIWAERVSRQEHNRNTVRPAARWCRFMPPGRVVLPRAGTHRTFCNAPSFLLHLLIARKLTSCRRAIATARSSACLSPQK